MNPQDQARTLRENSAAAGIIKPGRCHTISISGGKGGVGKSTLASNLAAAFGARGERTLLIDGDLGMADQNLLFGLAPERTLLDVLGGHPFEQSLAFAHQVHLLPAVNGSYQLANLDVLNEQRLVAILKEGMAAFSKVVIDVGAGIERVTMALAAMAEFPMIVATPEPLSLADAYACLKVLSLQHGLDRVFLVPNSVRSVQEAELTNRQLSVLATRFLKLELVCLPAIPFDPELSRAAARGVPLVLDCPDSPAARGVKDLVRALEGLSLERRKAEEARV